MTAFAPQYERNDQGWIKLPRDIEYRRKLFPNSKMPGTVNDVFDHPAKMNVYLAEALVEYLTKPGDWIMDPFGGAATTAVAARLGRNVVLLEIEDYYCELIKESASILVPGGVPFTPPNGVWTWFAPSDKFGEIRLYQGDNRRTLRQIKENPHPLIKCILTSPPYSSSSVNRGGNELEVEGSRGVMAKYAGSPLNLSQLNPFYWEQAMRRVWQGCADLLEPGGTMVYTCRDTIAAGNRDLLSAALIRVGNQVGLKFREWHKWELPRTLRQTTNINAGGGAVIDEDIIILEKSL